MTAAPSPARPGQKNRAGRLWLLLALLAAALAVLCHDGFKAHHVMWANDTALGALTAADAQLPAIFTGTWLDVWWIGMQIPASSPTVTNVLAMLVSPATFLKIFAPLTMLLLGFSAWVFFRQLKFAPRVCVLGGIAAGLNMHCFSNACWGLGTWNISISMIFLALAALMTDAIRQTWIKAALAGLAVGMAVMEGFDSGAILSVYVGVFVVFLGWITESTIPRRVARGLGAGAIMVFFSVLIAASTISTLVGTQIKGIVGTGQTVEDKKAHWQAATMWSLPKLETLRLIIPGIFGYRLENYDTTPDKAGVYWGKVGQDFHLAGLESDDPQVRTNAALSLHLPDELVKILESNDAEARAVVVDRVAQAIPQLQRRHTGSGEYAGVLVAVLAIFALACSARRVRSPYSRAERRLVWFWGLAALFSLMAAWGWHSFLYSLLYYHLPYFSVIRNPIKFLHPFHLIWIILAGYGLEALHRQYLERPAVPQTPTAPPKNSAGKLSGFEKGWIAALLAAAFVAALCFLIGGTAPHEQRLALHIQHQGFSEEAAPKMAAFAIGELGQFALYLALSAAVLAGALAGLCRGRLATGAWVLLTAIMICDLSHADRPWVRYFDYTQKYALNPIVDYLSHDPEEQRVAAKLAPNDQSYFLCPGNFGLLGVVCHWWLENDWPYHNIQSLDIDQMPRSPVLDATMLSTFAPREGGSVADTDLSPAARLWRLTNTRYLLAPAAAVSFLNDRADPVNRGFHIRRLFDLVLKPGLTQYEDMGDFTAVTNATGPYALIEITNALPRAKLYSRWQVPPDDNASLQLLNSDQFDPAQAVLVAQDTPIPPSPAGPTADAGTVRITRYAPKDIQLQAAAKTPAVLLLNDRTSPYWNVWVDQKRAAPLRCNYIMSGVFLTPGEHTIEFRFQPPAGSLYVSLLAIAIGIGLAGYLTWGRFAR